MALMERLRRIEAGIGWLETEGVFRVCAAQVKMLKMARQIEARLARDPGDEGARWLAPYLGIKLPPLPTPPSATPVVRPPPPPAIPQPAHPHPEEPRETRRLEGCATDAVRVLPLRDAAQEAAPQGEVVARQRSSPKPKPPPPPEPPWETHDIPEHMQIRPTAWRRRGPQDDDDDANEEGDDDNPGEGQCLTEYDPLADA